VFSNRMDGLFYCQSRAVHLAGRGHQSGCELISKVIPGTYR
jgi:hypothetical protein